MRFRSCSIPPPRRLGTLQGPYGARQPSVARSVKRRREALVVFQGRDHYITPSWYETKRETGKVVPTWNYVMVQAKGRREP